jgi:light-regulated signal transduction histidine kinase (bacteriophytochrome)
MNLQIEQGVILIVDDVLTNLEVLFDCLTQAGFKILVAENGESALQKARYVLPDLILLDVLMPEMDGFETCQRLKADPLTAKIPIIFMTALTETVNKIKGFDLGAVDYVTKPFQQEEVLARVRTHIHLQRLTRQLQTQNQRLEAEIRERQRMEEERVQAARELQLQHQRSQLLSEVTFKIRQTLNLQEILQTAVTEVQRILQADRVLIYRLWPDGTGSGVAEAVLPDFPAVLGYKFPEEVFPEDYRELYRLGRIRNIACIEDPNETVTPCLVEFVQQFQVKAKLVVPIRIKAELWGLLIAHQCQAPRYWTDSETELLQQLADQIGIAVTQAQLLEQETRQRQELARSNSELQQFAYIASHDLQEPLRMVSSYLQLLERRYKNRLDQDANDFIAYAVDGAARMKMLINDLLTYSRVGTQGQSFTFVDCNLLVQQAIANLKIAIEETKAVVTWDTLPTVQADATQLTQLLQNLIGNAIKFHQDEPPRVHVYAEAQDEKWVFSVQDNGIGIDPHYCDRIFVIFQRLHSRTDYPGTGIGLAICRKIVERHNGEIWVESQPGKGSIFHFTIADRAFARNGAISCER